MSVLEDLPEIPKRITKTQLKLDEVIALVIYQIAMFSVEILAEPWAVTYLGIACSVFVLYALKCIKIEKALMLGIPILIVGALAKLEHWWWASYALILGMSGMCLVLMYIAIAKRKRLDQRIIILSIITLTIANQAKIEHWWWTIYLQLIGVGIFIIGIAFRYYLKENKNSYDLIKFLLLFFVIVSNIAREINFPLLSYIAIFTQLLLFIFIILSFVDIFKDRIYTK